MGKTQLQGYDNNWLQYLVTPSINLSAALNPVLTCSLYWYVEAHSPFQSYDGWDGCNVWISLTNGNTWQILTPEYPDYTCSSLYSFGWRWEMGDSIPGWAGFSGGWTSARFNLAAFTEPSVRFRFAFASDAATCTANDSDLIGFFVDNVEVRDGTTPYLSNYGSGGGYPAEFTTQKGDSSGNFWVLTNSQWHSPLHSWNCDDRPFLSDALISSPILLPPNMQTLMTYWVHCLMPDANGDGDDFLDDFYHIEIAPSNSAIWTELAYDWAHNGSLQQWVERTNGYWNGAPILNLNLTPWAGQSVKLRFRVETDGNDDGGQGTGLYIDDVILSSSLLPNNDAGANRLLIPFPTYSGMTSINCTVDLINFGIFNQPGVPASWSINSLQIPITPWTAISPFDTVTRSFQWQSPQSGIFGLKAFTSLTDDENAVNDTAYGGLVEITPPGIFELGYDHRQITYLPDYYGFNFTQNTGPMAYFTPAAEGLTGNLYGSSIKAMFDTTGYCVLHIYASSIPPAPGLEGHNETVEITNTEIFPNWAEIDIGDVAFLQGGHPDFWVWFEISSDDFAPRITGHLQDAYSTGHFYGYDGVNLDPTVVNFNIRALLTNSSAVPPTIRATPQTLTLEPIFPNPFNSCTQLNYTLPLEGDVRLEVFDLVGRFVALLQEKRLLAGQHSLIWSAYDLPSGSYWIRMIANQQIRLQRVVLLK